MFKGLLLYIIHGCDFQGNINTRYCINKIMDYLEIKPELRIKCRVSKKANNKLAKNADAIRKEGRKEK